MYSTSVGSCYEVRDGVFIIGYNHVHLVILIICAPSARSIVRLHFSCMRVHFFAVHCLKTEVFVMIYTRSKSLRSRFFLTWNVLFLAVFFRFVSGRR